MPSPDGALEGADVLVVGGGPTGLLMACELINRGVSVRVVERAPAPVPYSKALLLWPRTMDVLAGLGLAGEAERRSIRINAFRYYSEGRELVDIRFPTDLASRALPQASTEDMLRGAVTDLGGEVERGVRLLALDRFDFSGDPANSQDVTAILEHPDGHVERSSHRWVVGCDGAGSTVRAQLGIAFSGSTYPSHFVLADAYVDGQLAPDEAHYFQSTRGVLVVVALPGGLYRFFASVARPPETEVDVDFVQRLVDERGPGGLRLRDPQWCSGFRVHCRQAETFQLGRAFLVGDAAHVHSPAGGQGLNTGLQDAHNLAWKLAEVIDGRAPYELLDSYTPERQPVARKVLRDTDVQTRAWTVRAPALVTARDMAFRLAHRTGLIERAYLPVMAGRRLRYDAASSTALCEPAPGEDRGALRTGTPVTPDLARSLRLPASRTDGWRVLNAAGRPVLGVPGVPELPAPSLRDLPGCSRTDFLVIRPDGIVAARGRVDDAARARDRLAELTAAQPVGVH
jgi:3-(3-hydroxy-phenyl)propionate hydroxylase